MTKILHDIILKFIEILMWAKLRSYLQLKYRNYEEIFVVEKILTGGREQPAGIKCQCYLTYTYFFNHNFKNTIFQISIQIFRLLFKKIYFCDSSLFKVTS